MSGELKIRHLTNPTRNPAPAPALIIAHPGHELLVHGWMQSRKPSVHMLSDGSGSQALSRLAYSEKVITASGASLGDTKLIRPDRDWYAAILSGDVTAFLKFSDMLVADLSRRGCIEILCDPLEFYNPLHDLANAVAHRVGAIIGARVASYEMQNARPQGETGRRNFAMNDNSLLRKRDSILSYTALAREAEEMSDHITRRTEHLYDETESYDWPDNPGLKPYYEQFAESRRIDGIYSEIITYRDHVRPMAKAILVDRLT